MSVEIIAEVAQGFEGSPDLARLLVRAAGSARADAVKFQLVYADEIAAPGYVHYDFFRKLEMPQEAWWRVAQDAKAAGLRLYFDVFGERSVSQAHMFKADGVKIHSTDFFHTHLIRRALDLMPRVFVSLGGIAVEEVDAFLTTYRITPSSPVCLMYGFQADPTPTEANHLNRLRTLTMRFPGYRFGFMDHADGGTDEATTLALLALPFGIECLEKHISLDRSLQLEDHRSALPPEQFLAFAQRVRRLEPALGTDQLELTAMEREYRRNTMKAVVAIKPLKTGEVVTPTAIGLKRTAELPPASSIYRLEDAVGRRVTAEIQVDQPLTTDVIA